MSLAVFMSSHFQIIRDINLVLMASLLWLPQIMKNYKGR